MNGGRKSVERYFSKKLTEKNIDLLSLFDVELLLIQPKQDIGDKKKVV